MAKRKAKPIIGKAAPVSATALAGGANACCAPVASSAKLWMEGAALKQLETVQGLAHVKALAGLPDLHPGRGIPIGAAVLTQGGFYPHIAGNDLGCGVSVWVFEGVNIKRLQKMDVQQWEKVSADEQQVQNALLEVAQCAKQQQVAVPDVQHPNADTKVPVAPSSDVWIESYERQLGTIGGGNHFVEITQVGAWDEAGALLYEQLRALHGYPALEKGTYIALIHSGSRALGQTIAGLYLDYAGVKFAPTDSAMGQWFWRNQAIAHAFAKANRTVLAHRLMRALGADDGQMLLDSWHNGIEQVDATQAHAWIHSYEAFMRAQGAAVSIPEQPLQEQGQYYLHRKGASSAALPINVLPSARGQNSYLLAPNTGQSSFLGALAHGAGRKWLRTDAKERLGHVSFQSLLSGGKHKSVIADKALVYEEAPQAYKNIDTVLQTLVEHDMATPLVALEPLLTIKA